MQYSTVQYSTVQYLAGALALVAVVSGELVGGALLVLAVCTKTTSPNPQYRRIVTSHDGLGAPLGGLTPRPQGDRHQHHSHGLELEVHLDIVFRLPLLTFLQYVNV